MPDSFNIWLPNLFRFIHCNKACVIIPTIIIRSIYVFRWQGDADNVHVVQMYNVVRVATDNAVLSQGCITSL